MLRLKIEKDYVTFPIDEPLDLTSKHSFMSA